MQNVHGYNLKRQKSMGITVKCEKSMGKTPELIDSCDPHKYSHSVFTKHLTIAAGVKKKEHK